MRRRDVLGVAWLVIGLCGCTSLRPERLDTARACADWRWIGITTSPAVQCPEVPGWTVNPLFGQVSPSLDLCNEEDTDPGKGPDANLLRELNRFCVYEVEHRGKKSKVPFPPAASAGLARFDQDCAALSMVPGPMKSKIDWEPDSKRFLGYAGQMDLPEIAGRPGVRLAFLDTHPTAERVPDKWHNSGHGYVLAHIARHLVCSPEDSERCAAQITTQLALPILRFDPKKPKHYETDEEYGGYLGLQSHLADAIRREVDSWQEDVRREGSPRHLVLNLSLAWDGDLFGGLDEEQIREMKAGTQAIYFALRYAASFDALVLAAAGNRKEEPCSNHGLLLPAAWESATLQEENCKERDAPLVYAVGGLRANGKPLASARLGGMPRRAACGEGAVVASSRPDFPTEMYTGSSVATAVVSSIAAVVWHFLPDRSSSQLMALIDRSGRRMGFLADFPPGTQEQVSELSLCTTLHNICADPEFAPPASPPQFCSGLASCPELARRSAKAGDEPPALGACQPWLYPQPDDPPEPRCNGGCPPSG